MAAGFTNGLAVMLTEAAVALTGMLMLVLQP
jgi:hypothetical protein